MPRLWAITGTRSTGHRELADYRSLFETFIDRSPAPASAYPKARPATQTPRRAPPRLTRHIRPCRWANVLAKDAACGACWVVVVG